MKHLAVKWADRAFGWVTARKRTVDVQGVTLSLDDVSPRMRRHLCLGRYEEGEAHLARQALAPGDRVVEAGGAIGFIALYCMKRIGVRDYHMVEANPALLPLIRRNFALNGLDVPGITHAAVAAEDGTLSFGVSPDFWASSLDDRPGQTRIEVPARSLPTILAGLPFRPNVLIMDIEGAEMSLPIEHFDPFEKVVLEAHPSVVGEPAVRSLVAALAARGLREVGRWGASYALAR